MTPKKKLKKIDGSKKKDKLRKISRKRLDGERKDDEDEERKDDEDEEFYDTIDV